jgi:hypothetical protein
MRAQILGEKAHTIILSNADDPYVVPQIRYQRCSAPRTTVQAHHWGISDSLISGQLGHGRISRNPAMNNACLTVSAAVHLHRRLSLLG